MSKKSNDQGRAYEFACLIMLANQIKSRNFEVDIDQSGGFYAAKRAWDSIDQSLKDVLEKSAFPIPNILFDLEPYLYFNATQKLKLKIQEDIAGENGDVRDILITRPDISWEIGLSVKHNHFAVKHSRLSKDIDFGEKWYGIKCSNQYWDDIQPIFEYLQNEKAKKSLWKDLPSKQDDVYIPLLNAFIKEVKYNYQIHGSLVCQRMVEYLLGKFDFYKIISLDSEQNTLVQCFNLRGQLNKSPTTNSKRTIIPIASLPTRIISLDFKPKSESTVELFMDNGWQFSFRIHNASSSVEPSLKFDIQMIATPTKLVWFNQYWSTKR